MTAHIGGPLECNVTEPAASEVHADAFRTEQRLCLLLPLYGAIIRVEIEYAGKGDVQENIRQTIRHIRTVQNHLCLIEHSTFVLYGHGQQSLLIGRSGIKRGLAALIHAGEQIQCR